MPSIPVSVAAAVRDELAAGTFAIPFSPVRAYMPAYDLKEMDGVRVTVVPRENVMTNLDRSRISNAVGVDIAVQRKLSSVEPAAVDPLMDLMQQIANFVDRRKLSLMASAKWTRQEHRVLYAPEHMRDMRLFTSVLTVTYTVAQ